MFVNDKKNYYQNRTNLLRRIVITSSILSLSFVLKFFSDKIIWEHGCRQLNRFVFLDCLSFLPLFFLPLYSDRFLSFIGVFLLEFSFFYFRGTLNNIFLYNPLLSLVFAFCLGLVPSFFLKQKKITFFKTYIYITFIFITYFFIFYILWLLMYKFVFWNFSLKNIFNFNLISGQTQDGFLVKKGFYLLWALIIKFLSIFVFSFFLTYFYCKIKKQIFLYF
ncbi:MAG: hypothetical protein Q8885_00160 [Candidatus Phytoplasma stylosanthis]|nr:hypothetical protein [Candidatus Phytoplasma stylosanthis]